MTRGYDLRREDVLHLKSKIQERLSIGGFDSCWEWKGTLNHDGYGIVFDGGKGRRVSRVMWVLHRGSLDGDITIDHLCRNRACANPRHLQPVSNKENTLRGFGPTAENSRKEQCASGHWLDGDNLIVTPEGWRRCRKCRRIQTREAMRRSRAALAHKEETP